MDYNNSTEQNPNVSGQPATSKTNQTLIFIIVILLLIIVGGGAFIFAKYLYSPNPTSDISTQQTASSSSFSNLSADKATAPSFSVDLTASWKTYENTKYGLSFRYPLDFKVEERVDGFIVISAPTNNAPQSGISIDARRQGFYESFAKAQENINNTFMVTKSSEINGWKTFDAVGKADMLKNIKFKLAIAPYKDGVIDMETIDAEPYGSFFDQIISTFKFLP